jgi:hypothetical protein
VLASLLVLPVLAVEAAAAAAVDDAASALAQYSCALQLASY